jgi:putative PEP-CTERM system histidine kinase
MFDSGFNINLWVITGGLGAFFTLLFAVRCVALSAKTAGFVIPALSLAVLQAGFAILGGAGTLEQQHLGLSTVMLGFWLVPPSWTYFSLEFGRDQPSRKSKSWRPYIVLISITGLLLFIWALLDIAEDLNRIRAALPDFSISSINLLYFLQLLVTSTIILIHLENTFRSADRPQRSTTGLMLFFVAAIFAGMVYIASQGLIYRHMTGGSLRALNIISCIASLGILWQSGRSRVFEAEVKLTRGTIYSSGVILLLGFYLLIIGVVAKVLQYAGGSLEIFISAIAGALIVLILLVILVSQSVQLRAKRLVDQYFSPDRFDYRQQWSRFAESMASVTDLDDLINVSSRDIMEIIKPLNISVFVLDRDDRDFVNILNSGREVKSGKFAGQSALIDYLFRSADPVPLEKLYKESELAHELDLIVNSPDDFEICLPLVTSRKTVGVIFLGPRRGDKSYTDEDYSFLDTWAHQLAVSILQMKFAENLAEARELESYHRLSAFVVHDLKNAVSMLSLLLKNAEKNISNPEFQAEAINTVDGAVEKMKSIIARFSSPAAEYEVTRSSFPADKPISEVIRSSGVDKMKGIDFTCDYNDELSITSNPGMIEKILNNLVINAIEAQDGRGSVRVDIESNGREITYAVTDSGPGIDPDFIRRKLFRPFETTKKKGLGIGLYQCREMARSMGGDLHVESEVGKGSTFKLVLPIEEGR